MTDITIVNQQITATITEPDQIAVVVAPPSEVLVTLEYAQGPGGSGGSGGGGATVSTDIIDFVEAAQDATGEMVSGNTEDGISVTYSDTTNKLNFTNTDKGSVAVGGHELATDPHPQYTTETEVQTISNSVATTAANAAVNAHKLEADPHPQYQTQTEGDARYSQLNHTHVSTNVTDFVEAAQDATGAMVSGNTEDGLSVTYNDVANKLDFTNTDKGSVAVTAHEALADPHPQYATNLEVTTIANSVVTAHEASSDPHPQYLTQSEGDTRYNVSILDEGALQTASVASINFVGSGVSTSTVGEDITVTINGGGGGGGGSYDLTQLATDVDALPLSAPLADDFDINMRDGATPSIVKVPSVVSEVILARGDRANLNNRITAISSIASPNAASPRVGEYYDNNFHSGGGSSFTFSANRFGSVPFITSSRTKIDQLGVSVTAAATGVLARCAIYSADPVSSMPFEKLFEGPLVLDCSTTGYKSHSIDFTFDAERLYWLVCNTNGTVTVRGYTASTGIAFGLTSADGTTYKNSFAKTGFLSTDPLPNLNPVDSSDLISGGNALPSFRMRAAAL